MIDRYVSLKRNVSSQMVDLEIFALLHSDYQTRNKSDQLYLELATNWEEKKIKI